MPPDPTQARLALVRAFHGEQTRGELGEDFDLQATRDITLEIAGEILKNVPRGIRRKMERGEADLLLNTLQFSIGRGFVAGIRFAKQIGAPE